MTSPLVFSHFGYLPYLEYTLAKAKESNPQRRLILLGDEHNQDVAHRMGWEHFCFSDYSDELHKRFLSSYKPVYGPKQRPYHEENPDAKAYYLNWLRYVTERWFFINAFITQNGIERFWHFDSDTMILKDLDRVENELSDFQFTTQCNTICLNGIMCTKVVSEYCAHICSLYENTSFIEGQQAHLDASGTDHSFTEMAAFADYKSSSAHRGIWLMEYSKNLVFDDCLCQEHGFTMVGLPLGREVKKVVFEDGSAYGWKDGLKVEFLTLNLSWLPVYVFKWVSAAQKGATYSDISLLKEEDMLEIEILA